jgi:hypothetical protein
MAYSDPLPDAMFGEVFPICRSISAPEPELNRPW